MQHGLVSIMMPAYNAESFISESIESALAQSYTQWELIIVNDGSIDRTADVVRRYQDPRIKLIHQKNGGEASARNTALKNARGEFLAFLDADDLHLPNHLEITVGYLSKHARYNGVYTDGYYVDQSGQYLQTLSSRRSGPFEGNIFNEVVYSSSVFGPPICVVLRTQPIRQRQISYDESIIIGPDWDFFMKYSAFVQFGYVDKITCLYRLHTSNISTRIGLERRALELSKCRINAIKMENFRNCTVQTRTAVFYDLLINLLLGFPEQQSEITRWVEFTELLPQVEQARLLRLMASKALVYENELAYIKTWLQQSHQLDSADWRGAILWILFNLSPKLLAKVLRLKLRSQIDPRTLQPFADIGTGKKSR